MDADGLAAAVTKQGSLVRQMKKVRHRSVPTGNYDEGSYGDSGGGSSNSGSGGVGGADGDGDFGGGDSKENNGGGGGRKDDHDDGNDEDDGHDDDDSHDDDGAGKYSCDVSIVPGSSFSYESTIIRAWSRKSGYHRRGLLTVRFPWTGFSRFYSRRLFFFLGWLVA